MIDPDGPKDGFRNSATAQTAAMFVSTVLATIGGHGSLMKANFRVARLEQTVGQKKNKFFHKYKYNGVIAHFFEKFTPLLNVKFWRC